MHEQLQQIDAGIQPVMDIGAEMMRSDETEIVTPVKAGGSNGGQRCLNVMLNKSFVGEFSDVWDSSDVSDASGGIECHVRKRIKVAGLKSSEFDESRLGEARYAKLVWDYCDAYESDHWATVGLAYIIGKTQLQSDLLSDRACLKEISLLRDIPEIDSAYESKQRFADSIQRDWLSTNVCPEAVVERRVAETYDAINHDKGKQ